MPDYQTIATSYGFRVEEVGESVALYAWTKNGEYSEPFVTEGEAWKACVEANSILCDRRLNVPDGGPGILRCFDCGELILEDDQVRWIPHHDKTGPAIPKPWHMECFVRSAIGGLNHLKGKCTCCGGTEPPDPPEMTRREAALAAWRYYCRTNDTR